MNTRRSPFYNQAWITRAACHDDNPDDYDTNGRRFMHETAHLSCGDCPVASSCARDALTQPANGTIRAGVPIPDHPSTAYRHAVKLLTLIANGLPVTAAATIDAETNPRAQTTQEAA